MKCQFAGITCIQIVSVPLKIAWECFETFWEFGWRPCAANIGNHEYKINHTEKFLWMAGIGYFLTLIAYSVWSYGLKRDPNLVYSHNSTFWQFSAGLGRHFFHNRPCKQLALWLWLFCLLLDMQQLFLFRRLGTVIATKKLCWKLVYYLYSYPVRLVFQ